MDVIVEMIVGKLAQTEFEDSTYGA